MDTQTPRYEVPNEMRELAERSVEQARKAFDGFMGAAHKAVEAMQGSSTVVQDNAKDMTGKALGFAEQNMMSAFEHAQRLVRAKDLSEVMRLQAEFAQSQFAALQTQMRDLGASAGKAATDMTKPGQGSGPGGRG